MSSRIDGEIVALDFESEYVTDGRSVMIVAYDPAIPVGAGKVVVVREDSRGPKCGEEVPMPITIESIRADLAADEDEAKELGGYPCSCCANTRFVLAEYEKAQAEIERLEGERCSAYLHDGKCDLVEELKAEIERLVQVCRNPMRCVY